MVVTEEFLKCCTASLEANFGQLSHEIINKIRAKKPINDSSSINDLKEFVDLIEANVSVFSGKHKAAEICNSIRERAIPKSAPVAEPSKPVVDKAISADIDKEINAFLSSHQLPTDADISDYSKFLTMKYGGNVNVLEKDIIERVKTHVRSNIKKSVLTSEIFKFLERFPSPEKTDVDDFVKYMNIMKLNIDESQMREELEKERLYRKFHEQSSSAQANELDQFISLVKSNNDKESIGKVMQTQGLSYLIKDDKGVSEKSLTEFMDIVAPNENDMKDALEGMGLKHLIKNKP